MYHQAGALFGKAVQGFFETSYPDALATFAKKDSIVLNSGLHYPTSYVHDLQHHTRQIAEQSRYTNATVLLLEPSNFEWPTRGGTYLQGCWGTCGYEAVTEERLDGRGALSAINVYYSNMTPVLPNVATFEQLYPDPWQRQQWWDNKNATCLPDCMPASWRTDLTGIL